MNGTVKCITDDVIKATAKIAPYLLRRVQYTIASVATAENDKVDTPSTNLVQNSTEAAVKASLGNFSYRTKRYQTPEPTYPLLLPPQHISVSSPRLDLTNVRQAYNVSSLASSVVGTLASPLIRSTAILPPRSLYVLPKIVDVIISLLVLPSRNIVRLARTIPLRSTTLRLPAFTTTSAYHTVSPLLALILDVTPVLPLPPRFCSPVLLIRENIVAPILDRHLLESIQAPATLKLPACTTLRINPPSPTCTMYPRLPNTPIGIWNVTTLLLLYGKMSSELRALETPKEIRAGEFSVWTIFPLTST